MLWQALVGAAVGLVLCWLLLLAVLWWSRPRELSAAEVARLLPNVVGLVGRLARDTSVPTRVRVCLWLLVAYLALPTDIVPDFIPVIGYADDAIAVALVLRIVVRASGAPSVMRHWRGSDAGRGVVMRLCGVAAA